MIAIMVHACKQYCDIIILLLTCDIGHTCYFYVNITTAWRKLTWWCWKWWWKRWRWLAV